MAGGAAAALFVEEHGGVGQVVFLLPQVAGGAELAEIIEGQRGFAALQQLFHRVIAVLRFSLAPVIEKGGEDAAVGCHQRVFHFLEIGRVAALDAAGPVHDPQITRVENHSLVRFFLVDGHGVAQVAGRAADKLGIVGRVQFFIGMAGQAHVHETGGGDGQFGRLFRWSVRGAPDSRPGR